MRTEKLREILKSNLESAALLTLIAATVLLLNRKILDVLTYWSSRIGITMWIHLLAGSLLIGILILIGLRKIDERFPSLSELELLTEGSLTVGLIGTVLALVFGFDELHNLKAEDLSLNVVIGMISEGLFSTGIGLCLSFSSWVVKRKLFPEEVRQKIFAKKTKMQMDALDEMDQHKGA